MNRIKRVKDKIVLHPIMTICFLILGIIVLSKILTLFNITTTYTTVSSSGTYIKEFVKVENLFSLRGLKFVFSNAVSNFASFAPLVNLIITLIGIGIMDKTGFLDSLFYVITKRSNKKVVTFVISLICILSSIAGDLSYVVLIPLVALLFKYGKRHPKAGVICAFASLTCGYGINILMNSIDSSLLSYTNTAAKLLSSEYQIGVYSYLFIMFAAVIILALIVSSITEKVIIPKLGHYELEDEKEDYLTKKEKRGLVISLGAGILYILFFIYNIIPNAPLGGNLLDYTEKLYIDKLFGYNSFFNQGFVFVVILLFFILGLTYGLATKRIKSNKEVFESLSYSLDKVGKVMVLMFFASSLIFIFKKSNIGTLLTAALSNLISTSNWTGIPLILLTFLVSIIATLVLPNSISKWSIISGSVVPTFMTAGLSPEFAALVFRAGECVTYGLTPFMAYFVVYIAFMELYSGPYDNKGLFGNIKYLYPYAIFTLIMWIVLLLATYVLGLPFGIGSYPGL